MATELERAGHELDDPLWSARVLLDDPGAVEAVHRAYLAAGADCILTATYQASIPGLAARGLGTAEAEQVLLGAVRLAVRARDEFWSVKANRRGRLRPLVAASVGPYGAFLADGSEYRGRYRVSRDALVRFHRRRWELFAASAADLIACETIPDFEEAEALAGLAGSVRKPAWLSFSCRDATALCDGTPVGRAADLAHKAAGVFATGVNCVAPELVPELVAALAARTDKPVVAYPNAGGAYDAARKRWTDVPPATAASSGHPARRWIEAGASAVGGCCRTGPEEIARIRAAVAGPGPCARLPGSAS